MAELRTSKGRWTPADSVPACSGRCRPMGRGFTSGRGWRRAPHCGELHQTLPEGFFGTLTPGITWHL